MANLTSNDIAAAQNAVEALLANAATSKMDGTGDLTTTGRVEYNATFLSLAKVDEEGNYIFDIKNTKTVLTSESYQVSVSPDSLIRVPEPTPENPAVSVRLPEPTFGNLK